MQKFSSYKSWVSKLKKNDRKTKKPLLRRYMFAQFAKMMNGDRSNP